ncbi:zinc-dependent alcohol dehydrogenase family protein [Glycomyces xiaoerkulensis]|uniref:zinc-dependent alcohol dehydrogenase family protein n=1 Tax=Glycomyces xiaoerkulensis TaxID=2038139 RepID=UPI000C261D50|nr:zinc-dependent alcohol dehydrogenase family protein [Glycomyces xiaoerkulensis]
MRAIAYTEAEQYAVAELEDRPLSGTEVRVENLAVGLCGTDLHLHQGHNYPAYPLTPGHEIIARVIETGPEVDTVSVGKLVAVDNVVYCMDCVRCKKGEFNFCERRRSMGTKLPGGFAEHAVAPAEKCYPIGDLPLEAAVLTEPTACALHGLHMLQVPIGARVLITGAGPSGLILAQLLQHSGAASVTVAAPTAIKLDLALRRGADAIVQVDRHDFTAAAPEIAAHAPGGFDVVVDATGVPNVLEGLIPLTAPGGTLMVYGMAGPQDRISLAPFEIFRRQLRIVGSFAQTFDFGRAIDFLAAGKVTAEGMITHRFGLEQYRQALDTLADPACVKAVIEPNGPVLDR